MNTAKLTILFFWRHAVRYPRLFFGQVAALTVTLLTGAYVTPLIIANVLSRLGSHHYMTNQVWASFGADLLLYAVLQIGGNVIGWRVVDYFGWRLEGNVLRDIAQEVFSHLLKQSPTFHANHFSGSLVSQTTKLMNSYIRFADATYFRVLPLISGLVFASIVLAPRAPLYASMLIIFAVVFVVVSVLLTAAVRRQGAKQAAAESQQTGNLADAIANVMAVKSFAGIAYETSRFKHATDRTYELLMRFARTHQKRQVYLGIMGNTMQVLSLFMAVVSAVLFHADLATVFLIVSYTGSIAQSLNQFSNNALRDYNRSLGDSAEMIEILQLQPEIADPVDPETSRIHRGEIAFSNVGFTHEGANDPLFRSLKLKIKAGEKVGLVGHSGSGKTTLTRLLLRFSDIQAGSISIDGQDISRITQDDLHSSIAYVPQEPILFHRSLRENISYGNPEADSQEVEGVAKLAHAHEFISALPDGYETLVGERGIKLSGGQRQRIAIARAMLKNSPILVLDEATAALDSESEALIQDSLWKLMEGRTAIVVAHRLSTIQKMDRIIVLEEGKVIEQGSHKELLAIHGTYEKLWQRQSGGFMSE